MKGVLKTIQNRFVGETPAPAKTGDAWIAQCEEMVETQIRRRRVSNPAVLEAMKRVPRHEFVSEEHLQGAYKDMPLPIGHGQTISQPYIVASMSAALGLRGSERALEIGTGCGYQAAVLSCLAKEVFTIERHPELAIAASERLARLGYENVHVHWGDGTLGLPEFAPYDAILVAAGVPAVPPPLLEQLADGGRLIVPLGKADYQQLQLLRRQGDSIVSTQLEACRFVPLIGYYGVRDSSER
jgi:protein-L-isoaspartate(D-aspartate) O-methyltransferase